MKKNNTPSISVIMATYNGEKYIREQLDSILNQTYPPHELIIQDDCSTDSTPEIIKEYAKKHECIHFFQNERNQGAHMNFKSATMRAKCDYIAFSDQDDVWYPQKLEKQIKAITDYDLCYSQHHVGYDKQHLKVVSYKCAPERQLFAAIVGHSFLMRRSYVQNSKNWLDYLPFHDISLCLMAHFENGVTCVNEPLNWHRSHAEQVSRSHIGKRQSSEKDYYRPYIYGYSRLRCLQTKTSFISFFNEVEKRSDGRNTLVHNICLLMLKKDLLSLLKLCFLCMKHRQTVYPTEAKGVKGLVRGFFYPFIYGYHGDFSKR